MSFISYIETAAINSLKELYGRDFSPEDFQLNETRPEYKGDYTLVLFSLVKKLKKSPEDLGAALGEKLLLRYPDFFENFEVIKGFLNLSIHDERLTELLVLQHANESYGKNEATGKKIMVEYSSPNTNKPLHLGHLRNIFLGWSMAEILKAAGNEVVKSSIVNDRGIHICKSMIAWQKYGQGADPASAGMKGDHFVGGYYVKFNDAYQQELKELMGRGLSKEEAESRSLLMKETRDMLIKWEEGDAEVRALWALMNGWVYEGFDETYKRIGCDFDKTYYESNTYLLGKEFVEEGLKKGLLHRKNDGSIWIDLTDVGLEEKLLIRSDGTTVYMTQDIGLAVQKFAEFHLDESIYVIGDEQNHHMKVLREICRKLGMPFADKMYHLSYGMVALTTGKMKSREGTVVDADDLVEDMVSTAARHTEALGKVEGFTEAELKQLYEVLALGAMKFYLLRVEPKKRMVFHPEESIDFHGFTGPFIQYTYARIQSILRKVELKKEQYAPAALLPLERQLILHLEKFGNAIEEGASAMNPALVANYIFLLAKMFNSFYAEHSVIRAESEGKQQLRIYLSMMTALVLRSGLQLLGIRVPERM